MLAVHEPGTTRTRSELEEMFLALCDDRAVRRPGVNVEVEGFECDFVWTREWLIVETDGAAAHGTRRARKRDPARDARLMAAGWRVWRVTWQEVEEEPDLVGEQLRRLLRPAPAAPFAPRPR